MKIKFKFPRDLRDFLILWSTQSFSALGSAMTSFALVIWSYQQQGSALTTAMLSICSYTPYVVMSIFAGALSDRWDKKRTMLFCDGFAALTTVAALMLLKSGGLRIGHIYFINALNGLMNTVQQPASDVAVSLLTPPERIQRVGGLRALSYSLVTVLSPMLATAMLTLFGLDAVMAFDLLTCAVAMIALAGWVRIPRAKENAAQAQPLLTAAREGLRYLRGATAVMQVILLLQASTSLHPYTMRRFRPWRFPGKMAVKLSWDGSMPPQARRCCWEAAWPRCFPHPGTGGGSFIIACCFP